MSGPLIGGDEVNAVVLDVGTYQVKAGYAGEDAPKFICPTAVGVGGEVAGSPEQNGMEIDERQFHTGSNALETHRGGMEVVSPFKDGLLYDWEAVEALWDHILRDQMRLSTEEHPAMLAEPSQNEKSVREKMVELMFEKYNVPAVFIAKNAVLSSFALGRQTSLVVDAGHESTVVSAVHDGYVLKKSIIKSPIGGHFLTKCMQHTIEDKGIAIKPRYSFKKVDNGGGVTSIEDLDCSKITDSFRAYHVDAICQDAKHAVCRQLSDNPFNPDENANIPNVTYELPDGQEIHIGPHRFSIPELLFNPSLSAGFGDSGKAISEIEGIDKMGLPQVVTDCIGKCDIDVRRELFNSIVLTGGTSLFASLQKRLEDEVTNMAPSMMKVRVTSPSNAIEKRYSTWIGGSILASLGTFQQMWMSKSEYKEYGAGLIHKKAP